MTPSPHRLVNPESLAPAVGFSHAMVAAPGRTVYLGGQTAHDSEGKLQGETLVDQFDATLANVVRTLDAAGARQEHLVSLHIFVTDAAAYRSSLAQIGESYRRHLGRHFPAMALFEVRGLFDPDARVEVTGVAVIPPT
ncbi:MAG: RidA family protein [Actinobacteria bacterium]|nr:RidA family protein [Actinomycetota bacterium]